MGQIGKYLYGVAAGAGPAFSGRARTPDFEGVAAVPYLDVAAVVGDREVVDLRQMRKDALGLLLVRHQRVLEGVMGAGDTVIPIRLGTFAGDDAEVREILSRGYRLIKEIVPKVQDKVEIDVAATWKDFSAVLKEVGARPDIAELKSALLRGPKGVTVDEQMKVGFAVKSALDDKRRYEASLIQQSLETMSCACRVHELMDDQMVANCAFLVSRAGLDEFYARVEGLDAEFSGRINFRCVGPLPAYSFYTIEVKKLDVKELEWAREKLGLCDDHATLREIKDAYHRAAVSCHPDKNPNRTGMEKAFANAAKAHRILAEYCLASAQSGDARRGEDVRFSADEYKQGALLVKVGE